MRLIKIVLSATLLSACGANRYESGQNSIRPNYQSIQAQILAPKCYNCHGDQPVAGTTSLNTHALLLEHVEPYDPQNSHLYHHIATGDMPQGGPSLSKNELSAIYTWIQEGGLDN